MDSEPALGRSTEYRDEKQIVDYFVRVLEHRLAGRHRDRIVNRLPVDECQLGVLGPWREEVDEPEASEDGQVAEEGPLEGAGASAEVAGEAAGSSVERQQGQEEQIEENRGSPEGGEDRDFTRRPPSSIGFEVLLEEQSGGIEIEVGTRFAVYTRHLPTLLEQRRSLGGTGEEEAPGGQMSLAEVCHRREVVASGIRFSVPISAPKRLTDHGVAQARLDQIIDDAVSRSDIMPGFTTTPKVPTAELADEGKFSGWLSGATNGVGVLRPPFRAGIEVHTRPQGHGIVRVSVYLRNNTPRGSRSDDNYHILADARLTSRVIQGKLHPIEILPVPEDYQYDRKVWAVGHNTSVEVGEDRTLLETHALARFEQPRLTTQSDPPARFSELARAPLEILGCIRQAMEEHAADWQKVILANSLGLDGEAVAECRKDLQGFRDEITRYVRGIAALRSDVRLLMAFQAMNRVMGRVAKGYDRWRLFQIVFIVTQLPALVLREGKSQGTGDHAEASWANELDWADVLWFPTGGGKTEAYFGLVSCAVLYDRLRGKRLGMTAWLRFPLRMLSVQQLQRATRMIWETEKERRNLLGTTTQESDPVRLGYFVGGATTPNQLDEGFFKKHPDAAACERYRVVPDCPACGGEGTVDALPDKANFRLRLICRNCREELPLVVSDTEVYRFLPSLLVGTIDKMATVGLQPSFGILWAGPQWRCPKHGYGFGEYCLYGCDVKPKDRLAIVSYDPGPALHIQDELHLLQEELGAFSGHYETLIRYCEQAYGGRPAKVVAATATIEGFEHQVRHLYGVIGARRFPGRGYQRHQTFYATLDTNPDDPTRAKTARHFVAFRPPSGSPSEAAALCAQIFHEAIGSMIKNPYEGLAVIPSLGSPEALRDLLYYYSSTLTYVGSLPGGTRVKDLLHRAAQTVHQGMRDLNVEYLSSRSNSGEVSDVIHRMDQPPQWEDPFHLDAIVATNMISHGVDLERINLMIMDRFPAETAEYIQASSRSGRRKVGLIAVVLPGYNLRAASIYNRFKVYHENLDRMVSPVPVNRFAKYAVHRTIPGVVSGLLFGLVGPREKTSRYRYLRESLSWIAAHDQEMALLLREAYALGRDVYAKELEATLWEAIDQRFNELLAIMRPSQERRLTDAMRPRPMTSLRDVDRGIPFHPQSGDPNFLYWFRRGGD